MNKSIIALSGKQMSGKSLVSDMFVMFYGYKKVDLAYPLKKTLAEDIFRNHNKSIEEKISLIEKNKHVHRAKLIEYGKKLKAVHGDIILIKDALQRHADDDKLVLENVRLKPEYDALKASGAVIIRVERKLPEHLASKAVSTNDITENDLDLIKFDYVIQNDGTVADLAKNVIKLWEDNDLGGFFTNGKFD